MSESKEDRAISVEAIASSAITALSIGENALAPSPSIAIASSSNSTSSSSSSPTVTAESGSSGGASVPHLGMSLAAFQHFVSLHPAITASSLTTEDINKKIITTATAGTGRAFIHTLTDEVDSTTGRPFVAPATICVSHAWKYEFVTVVMDVLEQHAAEHPDAYFWFDLFAVDQNKANTTEGAVADPTTAAAGFRGPILATRNVLLVLHPWSRPIVLKRAACLFEMFTALDTAGIAIEGKLPREDAKGFEEALREDDIIDLAEIFLRTNAEKATASNKDDLDMIFGAFRETPGGFDHVNKVIRTFLKEWFDRQLQTRYDAADKADADLFCSVALVYLGLGDFDRGIAGLERALPIKIAALGDSHLTLAELYNFLGTANSMKGAPEKAIEYFEKCPRIIKASLGEEHPRVAASYNNLGLEFEKTGDTKQAGEAFRKAIAALGSSNPDDEELRTSYASNLERVGASTA